MLDNANANQEIPKIVNQVDQELFNLVKGIDILDAIKPLNYLQQKNEFFSQQYSKTPSFEYRENTIDAFVLKRQLYNLPIESLDDDLYQLYVPIIDSYVDKIDQFSSIGTEEFLYDSLRYYGEPNDKDLRNAHFILHLPDNEEQLNSPMQGANEICQTLSAFAKKHDYQYNQVLDEGMIANALVSGLNVKINTNAQVNEIEMNALAHHELGVHLLTTLNAREQPLKVLSLGCPINTLTQEGLAILSEYLAGYLTIKRLKMLALRVLAVQSMIQEKNFRNTFLMLKEGHRVNDDLAFTITARVYRGGGFTKDYLYLTGFRLILNAFEQEENFFNLLAGKTSLEYLPLINRLIDRQLLNKPRRITPSLKIPTENSAIEKFITHAIY